MADKQQIHPMIAQADTIKERGLMVFDNINRMPIYNEPFFTPLMVITLNLQGWVRAECDMQPVLYKQHEVSVLPPHHILNAQESSPDYCAMIIVLSEEFQEKMKMRYPNIYRDNFHYLHHPDVPLNDEQFDIIHQLFQAIATASRLNGERREYILGDLLDALFLQLQDFRHENGIDKHEPSPKEQLFNRFYQAITEHYRESREVRYYANLFCLSPKHFSTSIKQLTNINALDWINSYVTIRAKLLLRYQQDMSIQQVAYHLGFPEQSTFTRFFKTQTGVSPKDYQQHNN